MAILGLNPHGFTWNYYVMHLLCRFTLYIFFRKVNLINTENIPMEGGLVLCGTHNNQFVDAMSLMAYFPREINFLVAAVSTKNKWLNFFLKLVNFIPTRRPQDEIFPGTGSVVSLKGDILKAKGASFTKSLTEKATVIYGSPKVELFVRKVIDDDTLEVDNSKCLEFEGEINFRILPKVDQSKMFDNCWKLLADGKVVGIFPEGGSHDQLGLLPIKAGVGIIYMGAIEKYNANAQVIACGINYDNGHKFRSTVILEFGVPYKMHELEVKKYKDPEQKKEVVNDFLQLISRFQ